MTVAFNMILIITLKNVYLSSEIELQNPILVILTGVLRNVT